MTYRDFLDLTPRQFANAVEGYIEREQAVIREQWEQTRWMGSLIWSKPVYGYKIRPITPKDLLPFPWDGKQIDVENIEWIRDEIRKQNDGIKNRNKPDSGNLRE